MATAASGTASAFLVRMHAGLQTAVCLALFLEDTYAAPQGQIAQAATGAATAPLLGRHAAVRAAAHRLHNVTLERVLEVLH